jgi:single-strand DNA-binding protein
VEFSRWYNSQIADVAERFLKKGAKVYVEGQLQTRKWSDQQGVERYSTEIVLARFKGEMTMLSSGNGSNRQAGTDGNTGSGYLPRTGSDRDDDIPFAPQVL